MNSFLRRPSTVASSSSSSVASSSSSNVASSSSLEQANSNTSYYVSFDSNGDIKAMLKSLLGTKKGSVLGLDQEDKHFIRTDLFQQDDNSSLQLTVPENRTYFHIEADQKNIVQRVRMLVNGVVYTVDLENFKKNIKAILNSTESSQPNTTAIYPTSNWLAGDTADLANTEIGKGPHGELLLVKANYTKPQGHEALLPSLDLEYRTVEGQHRIAGLTLNQYGRKPIAFTTTELEDLQASENPAEFLKDLVGSKMAMKQLKALRHALSEDKGIFCVPLKVDKVSFDIIVNLDTQELVLHCLSTGQYYHPSALHKKYKEQPGAVIDALAGSLEALNFPDEQKQGLLFDFFQAVLVDLGLLDAKIEFQNLNSGNILGSIRLLKTLSEKHEISHLNTLMEYLTSNAQAQLLEEFVATSLSRETYQEASRKINDFFGLLSDHLGNLANQNSQLSMMLFGIITNLKTKFKFAETCFSDRLIKKEILDGFENMLKALNQSSIPDDFKLPHTKIVGALERFIDTAKRNNEAETAKFTEILAQAIAENSIDKIFELLKKLSTVNKNTKMESVERYFSGKSVKTHGVVNPQIIDGFETLLTNSKNPEETNLLCEIIHPLKKERRVNIQERVNHVFRDAASTELLQDNILKISGNVATILTSKGRSEVNYMTVFIKTAKTHGVLSNEMLRFTLETLDSLYGLKSTDHEFQMHFLLRFQQALGIAIQARSLQDEQKISFDAKMTTLKTFLSSMPQEVQTAESTRLNKEDNETKSKKDRLVQLKKECAELSNLLDTKTVYYDNLLLNHPQTVADFARRQESISTLLENLKSDLEYDSGAFLGKTKQAREARNTAYQATLDTQITAFTEAGQFPAELFAADFVDVSSSDDFDNHRGSGSGSGSESIEEGDQPPPPLPRDPKPEVTVAEDPTPKELRAAEMHEQFADQALERAAAQRASEFDAAEGKGKGKAEADVASSSSSSATAVKSPGAALSLFASLESRAPLRHVEKPEEKKPEEKKAEASKPSNPLYASLGNVIGQKVDTLSVGGSGSGSSSSSSTSSSSDSEGDDEWEAETPKKERKSQDYRLALLSELPQDGPEKNVIYIDFMTKEYQFKKPFTPPTTDQLDAELVSQDINSPELLTQILNDLYEKNLLVRPEVRSQLSVKFGLSAAPQSGNGRNSPPKEAQPKAGPSVPPPMPPRPQGPS